MANGAGKPKSLYDRIGGEAAVAGLVDDFYTRVLGDPKLAPFFVDSSMDHLRAMQREFFAAALGGPVRHSGPSLAEVHVGRGIRTKHFALFVQHLLDTLRARGIDEQDAMGVISRINTYVSDVTGEVGVDG